MAYEEGFSVSVHKKKCLTCTINVFIVISKHLCNFESLPQKFTFEGGTVLQLSIKNTMYGMKSLYRHGLMEALKT